MSNQRWVGLLYLANREIEKKKHPANNIGVDQGFQHWEAQCSVNIKF